MTSPTVSSSQIKQPAALTWTLAICTYNRPHFLIETLRHALAQTRLPSEVVVVDASDAWEAHRDQMQHSFADAWATIPLIYVAAKVRSLTFQRNQALNLATSDIVFSLDDDIYLYPDAAEKVMRVYEADPDEAIAMVGGHFTVAAFDPDVPDPSMAPPPAGLPGPMTLMQKLRRKLEAIHALDRHFVPYDYPVDRSSLPPAVAAAGALPGGLINGGRTTMRRRYGRRTGWSELLRYYATHEDSDMSYRTSRLGRLANASQAGFFHADGNEGTTGRFRVNTIRVRNLMALHRVHSPNRLRSAWRLSINLGGYTLFYLLIDPLQKRFTFPTARAYAFGLAQVPVFMFWPFRDFPAWYTGLQEKMYGNRYKS